MFHVTMSKSLCFFASDNRRVRQKLEKLFHTAHKSTLKKFFIKRQYANHTQIPIYLFIFLFCSQLIFVTGFCCFFMCVFLVKIIWRQHKGGKKNSFNNLKLRNCFWRTSEALFVHLCCTRNVQHLLLLLLLQTFLFGAKNWRKKFKPDADFPTIKTIVFVIFFHHKYF